MTDWKRVRQLRSKGWSWKEIARDPKVDFHAEPGLPPGPSLEALYRRRGAGRRPSSIVREAKAPALRRRKRWVPWVVGAAVFAIFGAVIVFALVTPAAAVNVVTYCGGEGTTAHYHALLVIDDNGAQQHLPSWVIG